MGRILVFVPDLMMGTRIEEAAGRLGHQVISTTGGDLGEASPDLVLLTFDRTGDSWEQLATAARAAGLPVVAFGSHSNAAAFRRARELGCEVLPNSRFVQELPTLLDRWMRTNRP